MSYSFIIPTRRAIHQRLPLVQDIAAQSVLPHHVWIVIDRVVRKDEIHELTALSQQYRFVHCIHPDSGHGFQAGRGVSYVRNFGISLVQTDLLCTIDDDNCIHTDFAQQMLDRSDRLGQCLLMPTEYYRDTETIRSRGYASFNHRIMRPTPYRGTGLAQYGHDRIQCASSNCLRGSTSLFRRFPFDEQMAFVYEDLDMTRRLTSAGQHLSVVSTPVHHHMRSKTKLQDLYISTPTDAFQKSKNRILMIRHSSTYRQCLIAYRVGIPLHTMYLIVMVLGYRLAHMHLIVIALIRGTYAGFCSRTKILSA